MWKYEQPTGKLFFNDTPAGEGYSGFDRFKNDPSYETVPNLGPIPRGQYTIGAPRFSPVVGPLALPLTPVGHDAYGRSDFFMHGDSIEHPGQASHGCIILPHPIRQAIAQSTDRELIVV